MITRNRYRGMQTNMDNDSSMPNSDTNPLENNADQVITTGNGDVPATSVAMPSAVSQTVTVASQENPVMSSEPVRAERPNHEHFNFEFQARPRSRFDVNDRSFNYDDQAVRYYPYNRQNRRRPGGHVSDTSIHREGDIDLSFQGHRENIIPLDRRNQSAESFPSSTSSSRFQNYHLKVPSFDGKGKWTTFIKQFEAIANNCRWSKEDKLGNLLVSLTGEAADFTFELDQYTVADYDELLYQLDNRFRIIQTPESSQRLFYARKLQKGEQPRQFAADLRKLIQKAYPRGLSPEVREDMLLKQFFDGLDDEDARYFVKYLQHPRSLDDAIDKLHEYRTFCRMKKDNQSRYRLRSMNEYSENEEEIYPEDYDYVYDIPNLKAFRAQQSKPSDSGSDIKRLCENVESLTKAVTKLLEGHDAAKYKNGRVNKDKKDDWKKSATCYRCGEFGHIASDCSVKMVNKGNVKSPSKSASSSQEI